MKTNASYGGRPFESSVCERGQHLAAQRLLGVNYFFASGKVIVAERKMNLNSLRHTTATLLKRAGVDIHFIVPMTVGEKLLLFVGGGTVLLSAGVLLFRRILGVPTPDPTVKKDPCGGLPDGS